MSHTHAAVKYKPLGKAQIGAGRAGNFLFLAEKELEGGQREKPNTQATPGKSFPGRRRGSCDLKVLLASCRHQVLPLGFASAMPCSV